MEQQYGAPGAALAQAARTVLPGEPFDPPMPAQVPGPRADQAPAQAQPEFPQGAAPQWTYPPAEAPQAPAGYPAPPAPPTQFAPPAMAGSGGFETLQDFASLPVAGYEAPTLPPPPAPVFAPTGYAQEAPTAAWPSAPAGPGQAYGAPYPGMPSEQFPAAPLPQQFAAAPLPQQFAAPTMQPVMDPGAGILAPLRDAPAEEEKRPKRGRRRDNSSTRKDKSTPKEASSRKEAGSRKAPDKRLVAIALVALLGGGGYLGYNQFIKKSGSSTDSALPPVHHPVTGTGTAVTPVAATPAYAFPASLAGFNLQHTPASAKLAAYAKTSTKGWSPELAATMSYASYSAGLPAIAAISYHPAAARLAADYSILLRHTATPDPGSVVQTHVAVPGAAGGRMTCGGESGARTYSFCVWRGQSTIGLVLMTGSSKSAMTEILTRELRAYAEH